MKTLHFLSGLPRSGSTVLSSILNQNPEVYVTPTSPMLNVAVKMQEEWRNDPTVKANYYEEQARNITKAILPAFWQHRPEPIIIDKGRGWSKNMLTANALFEKKIKVIVVERFLPIVIWIRILLKKGLPRPMKIEWLKCGLTWLKIVWKEYNKLKKKFQNK